MRRRHKILVWLGGIQVVWSLVVRGLDWIGRYDLAKELAQRWTIPAVPAFLLSVPGQLLVFAAGAVLIFTGLALRPHRRETRRSTARARAEVPADRVTTIADSILDALREADGEPVYLASFDGSGSRLEIDEAVSRLSRRFYVEVLGGYPDPVVLYLTASGRRYVLQGQPGPK